MSPTKDRAQLAAGPRRRSTRLQSKHQISYVPPQKASTDQEKSKENFSVGADGPDPPHPKAKLTEENLKLLNRQQKNRKRPREETTHELSQLGAATFPSEALTDTRAQTVKSVRSSHTAYRYNHLKDAGVRFHATPPTNIGSLVKDLIEREAPEERKEKLGEVAKIFHNECMRLAKMNRTEGAWRGILQHLIAALMDTKLNAAEESSWRPELKPMMMQSFSELIGVIDSALEQNNGGTQRNDGHSSLNNALLAPAVATLPSSIKTPQPDLTIGIEQDTLISEMVSQVSLPSFDGIRAHRLLNALNSDVDGEGNYKEPVLAMIPTATLSSVVFPFAVIECRAYATGKQIFEAQNQAAGAGACGLNLQVSLNKVVKRLTGLDMSSEHPLFFSICSEGPMHELWVHYTCPDTSSFNMKLLNAFNGLILEHAEIFARTLDNVLRWGADEFLKSVVRRLGQVATTLATF